jgi:hypothetical protein
VTLEQGLADFLTHLGLEKNSSTQTVKSYREDLTQALEFLRTHLKKSAIESRDWNTRTLRAFVAWLHEQGYAKSTVARRLAAVRSFGKFLCRAGVLKSNPAEALRGPRQDKKLPHFLTVADTRRLLDSPPMTVPLGRRDRAILETLYSAGLLLHLGYDGSAPFFDPMCGSGTFPIEAAWIALGRPPGLTRKWFGFFGWSDFDKGLWSAIRDEARRGVRPSLAAPIAGSDVRADAIEFAHGNARAAGVGHLLKFEKCELRAARPPAGPPGLVVCNPPYGERLGEEDELKPLYRSLGAAVAEHWPGWRLAVFTSNDRLAKQIRMPVRRSTPFYNGSLSCKLWEFGAG